jgi:hypothetical protein
MSRFERNILQFDDYAGDYERLIIVRERARDMEEDGLQLMGWLLGVVDGLSNSIRQFLCSRPNGGQDGVSSTSSSFGDKVFKQGVLQRY